MLPKGSRPCTSNSSMPKSGVSVRPRTRQAGAWMPAGPTFTLMGVDGMTLPSRYAVICRAQPSRQRILWGRIFKFIMFDMV